MQTRQAGRRMRALLTPVYPLTTAEARRWPRITRAVGTVLRSAKRLGSIASFLGLLMALAPSAYATLYPWPVVSAPFETGAYIVWWTDDQTITPSNPPSSGACSGLWETPCWNHVASSSQVNYGTTTSYGSTVSNASLVYYHALLITGLTANTTYHYQVVSTDASNNTATSPDYTFTTLASPTGTVKTVKSSGGDYTSIQACESAASPGWTCEVYSSGVAPTGTGALAPSGYDANVSVSVSGSSGSPITIQAHDPVVVAAFTLGSSVSNVTVEGFEVSTTAFSDFSSSCSEVDEFLTTTNSNFTLANNYVHNVYAGLFLHESSSGAKSNYLQMLNNIMTFAGMTTTSPPYAAPCLPGEPTPTEGWAGFVEYGDHSLYDSNYFSEADHITYNGGAYGIYRRNVMSDSYSEDWGIVNTSSHVNFFHPSGTTAGGNGGAHMQHHVLENNQQYNVNDGNQQFLLTSACGDQSANQIGTGNGSQTTWSGVLSLTNADGTDTAIAPFSVAIVVNVTNMGCSGSQYSNATVAAIDDGFGNLIGYPSGSASGCVNYTAGNSCGGSTAAGAYSVTYSSAPGSVPITAYWSLLSYSSHDIIVRFNTDHYEGSSFVGPSYGGTPGVRVYNNTLYDVGYDGGTSIVAGGNDYTGLSDANPHWVDLNNLYYNTVLYTERAPWGAPSNLSPPAQTPGYALEYNNPCIPSGSPPCNYSSFPPGNHSITNSDPLFTSVPAYNFSLQSGSPALNAGTSLTTVASGDSGSGTSLVVNDAGLFQDGYGISGVNPDCIAIGTVSNTVCIAAGGVNYQTNTITLASSISRSSGQAIWLYSDSTGRTVLIGSAPNIGATFSAAPPPPPPPPPAPMTGLTAVPH